MTTGDGGTPFITCFENLICDQMIQNFPVTYYDVTNAYKIFGPNLTGLIAKTVCKDTTRIQLEYFKIQKEIMEQNKMVTLTADTMFVIDILFIITYGRGIGLITVEWIPKRTKTQLTLNLKCYNYSHDAVSVHNLS